MICPRCGRLNEDRSENCRFCSYDLTQDSSNQSLVPPEGDPYACDKKPVQGRKYKKYGIAILCFAFAAVIAIAAACIAVIPNGAEKASKEYINAYLSADFQTLTDVSAVDMQKYYQTVSQKNLGNLWGMFSPYSSYEQMLQETASSYAGVKSDLEMQYGKNFKISVSDIKSKKMSDAELDNFLNLYYESFGDILKNGEKKELIQVSFLLSLGRENDSFVNFYVIKIDSKWYVVTNGSLAAYGF